MKGTAFLFLFSIWLAGCTINIQIDTDYASQAGGSGKIEEKVNSESTASNTPTVSTNVDAGGL